MAPIQAPSHKGGDATLAVSGLVIVLAVISVALRVYTRIFTKAGLKYDDWLILAAVVTTLITAALLLWGMKHLSLFSLQTAYLLTSYQVTALIQTAFGSLKIPTRTTFTPLKTSST